MGGRRTNLGLLAALVAALASGALAFTAGTGWGRPVVVGHAVAGLSVLVLAPWKSVIVRRGLRRHAGAGRLVSAVFGVVVLAAVAAGLLHATGVAVSLGPVSAMQVHVGAALVALPLLAWHIAVRGGAGRGRAAATCRAGPCCGSARSPAGPGCCFWPSRAPPGWPASPAPAAASPVPTRSPPPGRAAPQDPQARP